MNTILCTLGWHSQSGLFGVNRSTFWYTVWYVHVVRDAIYLIEQVAFMNVPPSTFVLGLQKTQII